ncbi:TetR family transcriptional regulator [Robbsia sp. Bb-Pol-6]|uniref:TetR family transcriptional regulator n=1 Tax=Robbsia betulipollinis TaxID=2981849 RepID=A0ABT3ZIB1_9BURK|nr:TetR/AcrR family transcriptional regulator [Robbsia betulipollinis]MCY0386256.1 TetR family transcriptional regulator [Robbsia betulipollinis]
MASRDPLTTKSKILDAAEILYAQGGMEALTLRVITERAGVNLAAINYHFGSKEALACAMLQRAIEPLNDERLGLLRRLEHAYAAQIRPMHVLAAALLPLIRELMRPAQGEHRIVFHMRTASDPTPAVRRFMASQFQATGRQFDEAFVRSVPALGAAEALWHARLFFNAFPGTIGNQNMGNMLATLLLRPDMSVQDVLIRFGSIIEYATQGITDPAMLSALSADILATLSETLTVREIAATLRLAPGDVPPVSPPAATTAAQLAAAYLEF